MTLDTAPSEPLPGDEPLTALDRLGPKAASRLADVGLHTIGDLLRFFPRRLDQLAEPDGPTDELVGTLVRMRGRVLRVISRRMRGRQSVVTITLAADDGVRFRVVFFNQPYRARAFKVGAERWFEGTLDNAGGHFALKNVWVLAPGQDPSGPVAVRYRDVAGVSAGRLIGWISRALELADLDQVARGELPGSLGDAALPPADAVRAMHRPLSVEEHEQARLYFALVEAVELFRGLERARRSRTVLAGPEIETGKAHAERMRRIVPFEWTEDQARAVSVLRRALAGPSPCGFLVHGDVGTGKTAVAVDAAVAAIGGGYQVALLAPTELLAEQHFESISEWLEPVGVRVERLVASLKTAARRAVDSAIESGDAQLVIGTHALFSAGTRFHRLGLVIVDEQHRFGVDQRARLVSKARAPHVIVMTATPIPRTLALTLFGDLDSISLRQRPPGRRMPPAVFVPEDQWSRIVETIAAHVRRGGGVYVVCPKIGEDGQPGGAVRIHAELAERFATELVHGRVSAVERQRATRAFRSREVDVLVGTTVLEVGVDVASATLMVVVASDRFGIASLHQLRGRVGRGERRGLCILTGTPSARTEAVCRSADGFELAEDDLRIRGAGELLGVRQSGLADFRALDPIEDFALLDRARTAVREEQIDEV